MCCGLTLVYSGKSGFRLGSQGSFVVAQDRPFVSAKGPKNIYAQIDHIEFSWLIPWRADQLARLRQGPPHNLSVSPIGQSAGGTSSFSLLTIVSFPFDQKDRTILDSELREWWRKETGTRLQFVSVCSWVWDQALKKLLWHLSPVRPSHTLAFLLLPGSCFGCVSSQWFLWVFSLP